MTDNPELFDRMLFFGHPGRLRNGQAADSFDVDEVNLGPKYRPHVFAVHLANRQLQRLSRINKKRNRHWSCLQEELHTGDFALPGLADDSAVRGGFYRYVVRYTGAASADAVVESARASGVPVELDPFARQPLHRSPVFTVLDRTRLGGGCFDPTRPWEENVARAALPVTESLADRLISFDQLMLFASERAVRRAARELVQIAGALARG